MTRSLSSKYGKDEVAHYRDQALLRVFDDNAARLERAENRVDELEAERDRYRQALELIVGDSQRPELANAHYLAGIAMEALDG